MSRDCIAGSGVQLIDVNYLLKFSADQLWHSRDRRLQKLYFKKTFRKSSLESFAFGFGLIYVLYTVGGVYSLYTLYKEREPNYLITSLSFCRFTPSIKVVAYCYL